MPTDRWKPHGVKTRKMAEPGPGARDCGDNRGKRQRRLNEVVPVAAGLDSAVVPVADKLVQMLEQPPKGTAHTQQCEEPSRSVSEGRPACMSKCKAVHYEDVAEPEGREDMPTPFGWHEAVVPSEEPARSYQTKTEPAPPWKPPLRPGSGSASGVSNRDPVKRQRAGTGKRRAHN